MRARTVVALLALGVFEVIAKTSTLLVTSYDGEFEPCATSNYHGTYEDYKVFFLDEPCAASWRVRSWLSSLDDPAQYFGMVEMSDELRYVWVQDAGVDPSLRRPDEPSLEESLLVLSQSLISEPSEEWNAALDSAEGQHPFTKARTTVAGGSLSPFKALWTSRSAALIALHESYLPMIDLLIPRFYVPVLLPSTPLPFVPVPSSAIDRVINLIKTLKFSDQISIAVNSISLPQMLNDIRFLTGEDKRSTILTRHSFSTGALTAAAWLSDRFEETGAKCGLKKFSEDYAPNVICRYPSLVNTTETVILSAHYDSRGSWGSTRAPGGNDDGSGTVSLLGIARTILRKKIEFKANVELVAFAGEEQGLVGSRAYAKELRDADADITLMIQADMIAYHSPSEPQQLGLPEYIGTPEVATLLTNISSLYAPNLYVGPTRACCSDHQSFHQQGFPATQVFERAGWILDPMYHNSGDLSNRTGYDLEQVKSIAKVTFATLLHAAGFEMPAEGV